MSRGLGDVYKRQGQMELPLENPQENPQKETGNIRDVEDAGRIEDTRSMEDANSMEDARSMEEANSMGDTRSIEDTRSMGDAGSMENIGNVEGAWNTDDRLQILLEIIGDTSGVGHQKSRHADKQQHKTDADHRGQPGSGEPATYQPVFT